MQLGLDFSFVDKKKNENLETLAIKPSRPRIKKEDFHEFLRAYTDIFSKNIFNARDYTYKNLKEIINDPNLVVISGDKDSCVVVMSRTDYINKLEGMINKKIQNGTYKPTEDNALKDLKLIQSFLCRNFRDYKHYKQIRPESNQPAKMYGTTKTHKSESLNDIS